MYRVHVVCEGPTDFVVIRSILSHFLPEFVVTQIQPETSLYGGDQGPLGGGWKGVRSWCQNVADQGGMETSGRLLNADLLIIHIDADVADDEEVSCSHPCPPPGATTDALRKTLSSWLGVSQWPENVVTCIPSKSTEAWVLAALHPNDRFVKRQAKKQQEDQALPADFLECRAEPALLLIGKPTRLVRRKKGRDVKKIKARYQAVSSRLSEAWPSVEVLCTEAKRFRTDLQAAFGADAQS